MPTNLDSTPPRKLPESATADEIQLFLLSEMERVNRLMALLAERGVLRPEDEALATLESELKMVERRLRLTEPSAENDRLQNQASEIRAMLKKIRATWVR